MSVIKLARPELRDLPPYQAAVQVDDTIRLNANEAAWTTSNDQFRRPLNRYPELRPARLQSTLAERFGCAAENLLVTRGSSEAIDLLFRVFCRAGVDNVVTTAPSFSMYAHYARIQGAVLREVRTHPASDFVVSAESVLDACDAQTRLVFLCTPNNPTGTTIAPDVIETILEARREHSIVVVDEAYIEFSRQRSAVDLLNRFDNLVVLRTLSKALAFAGARCGAVLGATETVRLLNAVQAPYALATPVIECVEDALQEEWLVEAEAQVAAVIAERKRISTALQELPCISRVWPSDANFILVQANPIEEVLQQTQHDRILLRYFGGALADCVRITIGSESENTRMLESLKRLAGD